MYLSALLFLFCFVLFEFSFLYYFFLPFFSGVFCSEVSSVEYLIFLFNNKVLLAHLFFQKNFIFSSSSGEKILWGHLSEFY